MIERSFVDEPQSPWVVDVEESAFEREVIERSRERPVVVDFWAPWCGPCRALGPVLEQLAAERQGAFVLAKVNVDDAPELALRYQIEGIPAVKAFRDGRPVLGFVGLLPEAQLNDFLDRIRPSEADLVVSQAAGAEATDPAEAQVLYRRALEIDPRHDGAILGLARLLIAGGQDDAAHDLLERIEVGSEQSEEAERLDILLFLRRAGRDFGDVETAGRRVEGDQDNAEYRYQLGCVLAANGRYAEALDLLLSAAKRDRKLAASKVREVMVKIFQVVGVRSPLADEYRDKLSRLLY
ncbi:MAG TPA: tetratricopeptide repeat protein [Gemmataceae bacterium]|nr:tetratricopeptide repeat protein [Gemmataceae bacterium]